MSRILTIADLHLDHWEQEQRDPLAVARDLLEGLDGVIIAGDLSNNPKKRWTGFLTKVREAVGQDVPVHIVPGNHDYYDFRLDAEDRHREFADAAGAHFAQKSTIVFGDTRFLCATLWTDYDVGDAWTYMDRHTREGTSDFRYIRVARGGYRRLHVDDVRIAHRDHRRWLEEQLATPWEGQTVMVTHHVPHLSLLPQVVGDKDDRMRMLEDGERPGMYASDLSSIFEGPTAPDLAIYGHSHGSSDGMIGKTEMKCVSLGYPSEFESDDEIRRRFERAILEVGPAPAPHP